jgi:thiol-disulfide isomerase/thioredoxin
MRILLTLVVLASLLSFTQADDAKKPDDEKKPSLKVGDAPPSLKATKWLQGNPVETFEPGKVYVVEIWATWCGPCVAIMPHVAALQREFRDRGVTVVGFTAKDPGNTAEKVDEFVGKRGKKLGYTFAFADNRDTYDAYMKASGQGGIPCSFVIGKDGKLAYIGHPAFLDDVLPKVIAGTWDPVAGAEELAQADKEFDKVFALFGQADVEGALKAFADFEAKRPKLANCCYFTVPRLTLLMKAKKFDEARALAEKVLSEGIDQEDSYLLRGMASALRNPAVKEDKGLSSMTVKAAEAFLKCAGEKDLGAILGVAEACAFVGDMEKRKEYGKKAVPIAEAAVTAEGEKKTPQTLLRLAEAHFAAGDPAQAKEIGQQAVDAATNDRQKQAIKKMVEKFDPPVKDGEK